MQAEFIWKPMLNSPVTKVIKSRNYSVKISSTVLWRVPKIFKTLDCWKSMRESPLSVSQDILKTRWEVLLHINAFNPYIKLFVSGCITYEMRLGITGFGYVFVYLIVSFMFWLFLFQSSICCFEYFVYEFVLYEI